MRRFILFIMIAGISRVLLSNAAQPGFWGSSGFSQFTPLVGADSATVGKVRMQSEFVAIHIYRGFAVVKGTYHMKNLHNEPVAFTAGYPLQTMGNTIGSYLINSVPDSLSRFRVLVNNELQNHFLLRDSSDYDANRQLWYAWKTAFGPKEEKTFTVYFMVKISPASLRKGYDNYPTHPFIYITETGSTWQHPIGQADILVTLMDGLDISTVEGIWPQLKIRTDGKNRLLYSFRDLSPTDTDNLVLAISEEAGKDFSYENVIKKAGEYYGLLDKEILPADLSGWTTATIPDFRHLKPAVSVSWLWLLLIIVPVAAGVVGLYFVFKVVRRRMGY